MSPARTTAQRQAPPLWCLRTVTAVLRRFLPATKYTAASCADRAVGKCVASKYLTVAPFVLTDRGCMVEGVTKLVINRNRQASSMR